jgi:hypothetical protein
METKPEPFWATRKDDWGNPKGRYSFRGRKDGWACHHCGGLFRGLKSLLEHQERVLNAAGQAARLTAEPDDDAPANDAASSSSS